MRRTLVDKREKAHTYYNASIASSLRSSKSYDKGPVKSGRGPVRRRVPVGSFTTSTRTFRPWRPNKAIPQKIHYACTPRASKKLGFNNLFQSSGRNIKSEDLDDSKSKNSNEFGFGEYAETVGPQGLLFVLKGPDIPNSNKRWHRAS